MDAVTPTTERRPPLSPAEIELLRVLSSENVDERSASRETSTTVPELRTSIARLSLKLRLPQHEDHTRAFSLLARQAAEILSTQTSSAIIETIVNGHAASPAEWQQKLAEVAKAIAKGTLVSIDPYLLRPMRGQPRDYFPEEEQDSLAGSLGVIGQVQDVIIRRKPAPKSTYNNALNFEEGEDRVWRISNTEYEICDGERRWRGVMSKKLPQIRAKLIEIDDEGAYLVAAVSNLNRVGHTTLEQARNIKRLMEGTPPFPIEVVATMQGISVTKAQYLLATLELPSDIHQLMDPVIQRSRGQDVLGKSPSREISRLARNPALHENAREIVHKYVRGEIKLPELRSEVDRVLASSGGARDVIAERHQPARRIGQAKDRLIVAQQKAREALGILKDLKQEKILPAHDIGFGPIFNSLIDLMEDGLRVVGAEREKKK